VPPELHIESWLTSVDKLRALNPARLYLPHFGLVDNVATHFDQLEERVRRWSEWFRGRMCAGDDEPQLLKPFADYEAADLLANGASEENVRDYETADPTFMAVTAALRYWRKYHPEKVTV
jgi:hypothetical protein